jgi:hypothetical protein
MSRASYSEVPRVDSQTPMYNPLFSYQEPLKDHTVCFLGEITFLKQLRSVRAAGLGGFAISRLGQEDPQIWDVLAMNDTEHPTTDELKKLNHMTTSDTIANVGQREIVTVDDTRDDGTRTVRQGKNARYALCRDQNAYPHPGIGREVFPATGTAR